MLTLVLDGGGLKLGTVAVSPIMYPMIGLQLGSQFYGTFDFTAKPFNWGKGYKRPEVGVLCSTPRISKTRTFHMRRSERPPNATVQQ